MTAVALALSGDALLAARQLRAASVLIAALPDSELVSVWILSLDPRPVLVSDVRKLWLGGRKHIDMRLNKVQDALSQAGPLALTSVVRPHGTLSRLPLDTKPDTTWLRYPTS
jgi:hypothetical protein